MERSTNSAGSPTHGGRNQWEREFNFLLWFIKIDSGSDREFFTSNYRVSGYEQRHVYSKRKWLFMNISCIALAVVAIVLTLILGLELQFGVLVVLALIVLLLLVIYSALFVYVTFVPPIESS